MALLGEVKPVAKPAVTEGHDSRTEFMPIDPLGTNLGSESISGIQLKPTEQIGLPKVSTGLKGAVLDDQIRQQRAEFYTVIAVIAVLVCLVAFFYFRSGQRNFAGQGSNRN
jgi:hypothetical protein